jgi:hypothetical protein
LPPGTTNSPSDSCRAIDWWTTLSPVDSGSFNSLFMERGEGASHVRDLLPLLTSSGVPGEPDRFHAQINGCPREDNLTSACV